MAPWSRSNWASWPYHNPLG